MCVFGNQKVPLNLANSTKKKTPTKVGWIGWSLQLLTKTTFNVIINAIMTCSSISSFISLLSMYYQLFVLVARSCRLPGTPTKKKLPTRKNGVRQSGV